MPIDVNKDRKDLGGRQVFCFAFNGSKIDVLIPYGLMTTQTRTGRTGRGRMRR